MPLARLSARTDDGHRVRSERRVQRSALDGAIPFPSRGERLCVGRRRQTDREDGRVFSSQSAYAGREPRSDFEHRRVAGKHLPVQHPDPSSAGSGTRVLKQNRADAFVLPRVFQEHCEVGLTVIPQLRGSHCDASFAQFRKQRLVVPTGPNESATSGSEDTPAEKKRW